MSVSLDAVFWVIVLSCLQHSLTTSGTRLSTLNPQWIQPRSVLRHGTKPDQPHPANLCFVHALWTYETSFYTFQQQAAIVALGLDALGVVIAIIEG
jgi:hypothetical protein